MKRIPAFLILLPAVLMLTACGKTAPVPAPTAEPAVQVTATPAPTPAPQPTPALSEDEAQLTSYLTELPNRIQPGSAGCSMKAANQAAFLLDWLSGTQLNSEELYNITAAFVEELPEGDIEYSAALSMLNDTLLALAGPGQEELLVSSGYTGASYPWADEVHKLADYIMLAAGMRQEQASSGSADSEAGVYGALIDAYFSALAAADPAAALTQAGLNSALSGYFSAHPLSSLGYCLYDINSDGSRELLIGPLTEPYLVLDIYTLSGSEAASVFFGSLGNVCAVTADGTIVNYVIQDEQRYAYNFLTLSPQGLSFTGGLTHDSVYAPARPWYESTDMDMQVYNDTPCSTTEAEEKINAAMASFISFDYEAFALLH